MLWEIADAVRTYVYRKWPTKESRNARSTVHREGSICSSVPPGGVDLKRHLLQVHLVGGWEPVLPVLHTASTASYSPHFGVGSPMPPR